MGTPFKLSSGLTKGWAIVLMAVKVYNALQETLPVGGLFHSTC